MFSEGLITRTIQYFKENHNHSISRETAESYLESLTDLFTSYMEVLKGSPELIKMQESSKMD